MTTDDILSGLQNQTIGRRIHTYDRVGSTNDLALQCGVDGAEEGTLILAESQTQGRGRHGRKWLAPPGSSILGSIILRHRLRADQVGLPNLIGAVAIATATNELTNLSARIKWPNDVLIQGKKVSGVLTELEYDRHRQPFFVMGFGVNVNMTSADLPEELRASATSLRIESGRKISRVVLLQTILHRLEENYLRLKRSDTEPIIATGNRLLHFSGDWAQINTADGIFCGETEAIDQDGGLLLKDMNGNRRKFLVGEVLQTGQMTPKN
ncbi:biotin--[acetyl-CoA-carboxylase] ligase [Candidatus Poribacteria bacterium]|nr:biotin--[acetyl-CoA-carboxylase] ligase [Candidatus Poribacteria bacterium]